MYACISYWLEKMGYRKLQPNCMRGRVRRLLDPHCICGFLIVAAVLLSTKRAVSCTFSRRVTLMQPELSKVATP